MNTAITAQDLWHLVVRLPHDEQLRLARLALHAATNSNAGSNDASAYATIPVTECEFDTDEDMLAWDAGGWEEFDALR